MDEREMKIKKVRRILQRSKGQMLRVSAVEGGEGNGTNLRGDAD